jgi:hypothetical protein
LKALRTVNGQLGREVESLKARLAEDEATRLQAHRLTELQNKTVVMVRQPSRVSWDSSLIPNWAGISVPCKPPS